MNDRDAVGSNSRKGIWLLVLTAILFVAGVGLARGIWQANANSTSRLLIQAKQALDQQDYPRAESLGLRLAERPEVSSQGWLIAAESADRQGQFSVALYRYSQVPQSARAHYVTALMGCGDMELEQLQLGKAEDFYQRLLAVDPGHVGAHDRLATLLAIEGRYFESARHRLALIRGNQYSPQDLVLLAMAERTIEDRDRMERFRNATPDDPRALCGPVREALRENRREIARPMLAKILQQTPELLQAQAWQGAILVDEGNEAAFLAWQQALPSTADQFPEIWRDRGDWAHRRGEGQVAIRCYWEAARLDPNHQPVHYQLGQLLAATGEVKQAQPFLTRAQLLEELVVAVRDYHLSNGAAAAEAAAALTERLGLYWESLAWNKIAFGESYPSDEARQKLDRLLSAAQREPTLRTSRAAQPALQIDLSAYPLPNWGQSIATSNVPTVANADGIVPIAFADFSATAALQFRYFGGRSPSRAASYYYEHNGGGVAILDYDRDGWPDIHFTQGCTWPPQPEQRDHLDRLFRNLAGKRFADVTEAARLIEAGFSQGVTVGDYDDDGFDDLYVCNIGTNCLFHNNGDGTFSDLTREAGVLGGGWSSSCAMADVNGDGWPDLYVVKYLEGKHLFDIPCQTPDGHPRLCTPHEHSAAQDQLYLNLGNGDFADESERAGIMAPDGKGLGIVAADFDGSGKLSLFIANDATLNFFFRNNSASGEPPRFSEDGLLSGLAVDAEGRSQACMGVAAGDADGDQRLDLYVTNFREESNTLYSQLATAQFVDQTRRAGLRDPSYEYVGFGTQFLDADLDGLLDLVLTNGHVGDMNQYGEPYAMPAQFLRNVGGGRFVELPAKTLGEFFEGKYVGRGLAKVDWNRDGLDDVVVSHLTSPAALVTNQTRSPGHYLALRLCGINCARDAIGTVVVLQSGDQIWTAQLTAGDGYQASNERVVRFGLGKRQNVNRIEIRWPSGLRQMIESPTIDRELLVVEGHQEIYSLSPQK